MTTNELKAILIDKGVPQKYYALDGKDHVERNWAIRKSFTHYEVYSIRFGQRFFIYKFKTESEACDFLYNQVIQDCLYDDIKLKGIQAIKHKKTIVAPKYLHEDMTHIAELHNIKMNYKRDIHSLTFDNGYTFESECFFQDCYYKDNAIICLNSSNENNWHKNCIGDPNNVFMINDKGDRVWTFKRSFIFPDRNTPVGNIGIDYNKDEIYLYVYDDEHYRPEYVLDPSTGILLKRKEELSPPRSIFRSITFRRKK